MKLYTKSVSLYHERQPGMNGKLRITSNQYMDDGGWKKLHLSIRFIGNEAQPKVFSAELTTILNTISEQAETVVTVYRNRGHLISLLIMADYIRVVGVDMDEKVSNNFICALYENLTQNYQVELVQEWYKGGKTYCLPPHFLFFMLFERAYAGLDQDNAYVGAVTLALLLIVHRLQ